MFYMFVGRLMSAQPTKEKYKRLVFTVGETVTHSKSFSIRFYRFVD